MNSWTSFVKIWAADNKKSYACAMTDPRCKKEYKNRNNTSTVTIPEGKRIKIKKITKSEVTIPEGKRRNIKKKQTPMQTPMQTPKKPKTNFTGALKEKYDFFNK